MGFPDSSFGILQGIFPAGDVQYAQVLSIAAVHP